MDKNSEELASNLSYEIVKVMAPEELDLFEDIKEEFLENPDAFKKIKPTQKEEMLGFGGGIGEVFVTNIIFSIIWDTLALTGKKGIESFTEKGSNALAKWIQIKLEGKKEKPSKEKIENIRWSEPHFVYNQLRNFTT